MSEKALRDVYQGIITAYIADKVPNVRVRGLQVLKSYSKLGCPATDKALDKLKDDKDMEVKEALKRLRA